MQNSNKTNTITVFYLSFMVTPILYGIIATALAFANAPILPSTLSIAVMAVAAMMTWSMTTVHWAKARKVVGKPTSQWLKIAALMQVPIILSFLYYIISLQLPGIS
ncbi:MAG TPA: hypothetical protein DCR44_07555 [Acholeplasmatales bacterium]|nr:hypothetical protein [Acholeplasmatales bacterium]